MLTPTKRTVRVTLDIECYDDLELESFDWNDILSLEGDESVYVTTEEVELWWYNVPVRELSTPSGVDFLWLPEGRVSDDLVRHQAYPRSRLISYKIPPPGDQWEIRVPLSEVSTIATQGTGLVYC